MPETKKGKLFVITGSSGVGKTTIADAVLSELPFFQRIVTCTTRAPREGEQNGVDYNFFSKEKFEELVSKGEFLEHATVYGNYYGSLAKDVQNVINSGKSILMLVDVQGAKTIKQKFPEAITIFVKPPSLESLRERLEKRSKDGKQTIEQRLSIASEELSRADEFDHAVVNDDLARAVFETKQLISDELNN
ncbi:MAG: guanylate kinase [archaeon]|jgi:guanylate kinase